MKITDIYDFLSRRRGICWTSLLVFSAILAFLLSSLHFSEDISDFLPLGTREREQMSVYQNISGADKLIILVNGPEDPDRTVEAADYFIETALDRDDYGWCRKLTAQIDMDAVAGVSGFVYENAPYFLTEADLERMDSLLAVPGYVQQALERDRQALLFPYSLVRGRITHDPLGLFDPLMSRLQSSLGQSAFELYDDYIFTPDMRRAVLMLDSPFGSSETSHNARLMAFLEGVSAQLQQEYPDVSVDIIGGPAIAVGNASRIKKDSILAISLSVVLIFLLLAYSFNSLRNILLIFLTVGWGLLFALGSLSLFRDNVSIIVIGIASVILGIAINYPLHLISHTAHQPDKKLALKEILSPLVVGNITTVGAFLALVPLRSVALQDLGLFASLLLVGTIFFVLIYLPHAIRVQPDRKRENRVLERLSAFSPERHRWLVVATVVITLALFFFSFRTQFDADISHINYMTREQRRDMQYFEDLTTGDATHTAQTLYVYGSGRDEEAAIRDLRGREALLDSLSRCGKLAWQNAALSFFCSREQQQERLGRWALFVQRHQHQLLTELADAAAGAGFKPGAFAPFTRLVLESSALEPQDPAFFAPMRETVFSQSFTSVDGSESAYFVCPVNVEPGDMDAVKSALGEKCFEIAGINQAMTSSLSDNFNYIGWACSLIVFLFLWFSFGRLELALISFLPMAVSWVWILGIMALAGIQFNIVNIILATFIFGQGDDYTIFMTEGCQYEYSRRKPILQSFKGSILQSAAIMFAGMGTLIVARHPAMHSLAQVTIIGMLSVVLMAYLIPPLLFRWMTQGRRYPFTLKSLLLGVPKDAVSQVRGRYIYKGTEIERCVRRNLRKHASAVLEQPFEGTLEYADPSYGELSILLALSHPDGKVVAHIPDEERRQIAQIAADGFVNNVVFIP